MEMSQGRLGNKGIVKEKQCQILSLYGALFNLKLYVHTVKENAEALVVATKEIGLDVNAEKLSTRLCLEIRTQDEVTV